MSESSDPYLYPGTDVLRNTPGIRNAEALIAFETLNSGARMYKLSLQPTAGNFDTGHLKAIHKYIFQDLSLGGSVPDNSARQAAVSRRSSHVRSGEYFSFSAR